MRRILTSSNILKMILIRMATSSCLRMFSRYTYFFFATLFLSASGTLPAKRNQLLNCPWGPRLSPRRMSMTSQASLGKSRLYPLVGRRFQLMISFLQTKETNSHDCESICSSWIWYRVYGGFNWNRGSPRNTPAYYPSGMYLTTSWSMMQSKFEDSWRSTIT